jgi:DNA-binding response OmpR family regulator
MHDAGAKLLIVDNDVSIRRSLSLIFMELGYCVRYGEDGISALSAIRMEIPDVLLADLSTIRRPGLDFLALVRRWYPSIRVIAMGGASSGNHVPTAVAADAFYQKGVGPDSLIAAVGAMTKPTRLTSRLSMDDLFGFRFFEAIPPHPDAEGLPFPAPRTIVFPAVQRIQQDGIFAAKAVAAARAMGVRC